MKLPTYPLNRRNFSFSLALCAPIFSAAQTGKALDAVKAALNEFRESPELSAQNYSMREFAENFPVLRLERAPSKVLKSQLEISQLSKELIIAFEVSSKEIYEARYEQPTWPGGQSGVTIGIGYDLGYVSKEELKSDWPFLAQNYLDQLASACGQTNLAARDAVSSMKSIRVSWSDANDQFKDELKKYVTLAQKSLPNFSILSEHCRGALASLTFNRGASFDADGPRYAEMRNIKSHMEGKEFARIPAELRGMTRIWPAMKGLRLRRNAEADLFESGL